MPQSPSMEQESEQDLVLRLFKENYHRRHTFPPDQIPDDSLECLLKFTMPPIFIREVDQQLEEDAQEYGEEQTPTENSLKRKRQSTTSDSQRMRKRVLCNDRAGASNGLDSGIAPLNTILPAENQSASAQENATRVGPTPGRAPFSEMSRALFELLDGDVRFSCEPNLVANLVKTHIKMPTEYNRDPSFLLLWLTKLINAEDSVWDWTDRTSSTTTIPYKDRVNFMDNTAISPYPVDGGELGLQTHMKSSLFDIANAYVKEANNLGVGAYHGASWGWAPNMAFGTSYMANRQYDRRTLQTKFEDLDGGVQSAVVEVKLAMRTSDGNEIVDAAPFSLHHEGSKILCKKDDGSLADLKAVNCYSLAQVVEKLHANKARFAILTNYDFFILFRMDKRCDIKMSPVIYRDPEVPSVPIKDTPLIVNPLTLHVALLLSPGDSLKSLDVNPWVDMDLVKTKAKGFSEASKSGKSESAQQQFSTAKSVPTSAAPAPQSTNNQGESSKTNTLQKKSPMFWNSKEIPVAPTSISVSAPELAYHSAMYSRHGLMCDDLPDFTWEMVEVASSVDTSCPVTPEMDATATIPSVVTFDSETTTASEDTVVSLISTSSQPKANSEKTDTSAIPHQGRVKKKSRGIIELDYYISHGRLWDTYGATYENIDLNTRHNIIAKISCLETNDNHSNSDSEYVRENKAAILNEAELYSGRLSALQHDVVPGYLGLFTGTFKSSSREKRYFLMLMEHAGHDPLDLELMAESEKKKVIEMFEKIHALKVAHGDVHSRHVLQDDAGNWKLIDFEGAIADADSVTLSEEMEEVKSLLYGSIE